MPSRDEIQDFSAKIIELVEQSGDMSYIDAIVHHCSESGIEVELAVKLISEGIKVKLRTEAENLHFLKR